LKSQDPIRAFLQEEEEGYKSPLNLIFNVMDSDKYAEKFSELTSKGNFQNVGEGGNYPRTSQQVGYEQVVTPSEWKLSFEVTETMIEDAKMFNIKSEAADFIQSYYRTRDQLGAQFLINGNATSFVWNGQTYPYTSNDTVALFSAAHTSATGNSNFSAAVNTNYLTGSSYVFSYDNLASIENKMQKFTDHDGNILNIQPDTIIIPNDPVIKKAVADAVFTDGDGKKPGTTDAGFNYHAERWNVVVWNQLTVPTGGTSANGMPWWVMDSKRCQRDGLIWIDRVGLRVRSWIDENTGNNVFGGRARFGAGAVKPVSLFMVYPT
jgi:hypothetical protein